MDISGDSTPTSEASYSLSGTPTTHGGSGGGGGGGSGGSGAQSSEQSSIMGALTSSLGNPLPRLASHPNTSAVVTPMGAHYGAVSVGATGGNGGGPVSGATMLPTSGLASVPASIANSSNSLRNSVVGIIGSTSSVSFDLIQVSSSVINE